MQNTCCKCFDILVVPCANHVVRFQAATGHSFHLPEDLALQSVTSVPAHSLEIDHRVGYARPGYDADLVVWDSHPLSVGATALQVYIDGRPTLDPQKVEESLSSVALTSSSKPDQPKQRALVSQDAKNKLCPELEKTGAKFTVTGIKTSHLDDHVAASTTLDSLTMVVDNGKIVCLDTHDRCATISADSRVIKLENGHVLPGLTAVSASLGLTEIATDSSTGDGELGRNANLDPKHVVYAKYGIHLEGRGFCRARIGGVTRAITAPMSAGFAGGVSVAIKTSGNQTILNGGVVKDDVALHFMVGQPAKGKYQHVTRCKKLTSDIGTESIPTISSEMTELRLILDENKEKDNVYGKAANGTIPLVVHADNEVLTIRIGAQTLTDVPQYDIMQLIKIKQEYPSINLVIFGGAGAPLVSSHSRLSCTHFKK